MMDCCTIRSINILFLLVGPVCAYVGTVVDHAPPFTLYCKVDQLDKVPVTALMTPPLTVQVASHVLFVTGNVRLVRYPMLDTASNNHWFTI